MTGTKRALCTLFVVAAVLLAGAAQSPAATGTYKLVVAEVKEPCTNGSQSTHWAGTARMGSRLGLVTFNARQGCDGFGWENGGTMAITELDGSSLSLVLIWGRKNILEFTITGGTGRWSGAQGSAVIAFSYLDPSTGLIPVITGDLNLA